MTQFTLGASDVRAACSWGAHRTRTVLSGLPYMKAPASPNGGNRIRLYRLGDVLENCWRIPSFDEVKARNLILADQKIRSNSKETN